MPFDGTNNEILARLAQVKKLSSGNHEDHRRMCVMEATAFVMGEAWSDRPRCVDSMITSMMIVWNDRATPSERQGLIALIPELIGTRTDDPDLALARGKMRNGRDDVVRELNAARRVKHTGNRQKAKARYEAAVQAQFQLIRDMINPKETTDAV